MSSIHSLIKGQLAAYRDIATKYMKLYMSLFVFVRKFQKWMIIKNFFHLTKIERFNGYYNKKIFKNI